MATSEAPAVDEKEPTSEATATRRSRAWTYVSTTRVIQLDDSIIYHCRQFDINTKTWHGYIRFRYQKRKSELWMYSSAGEWTPATKRSFRFHGPWERFGTYVKQGQRTDLKMKEEVVCDEKNDNLMTILPEIILPPLTNIPPPPPSQPRPQPNPNFTAWMQEPCNREIEHDDEEEKAKARGAQDAMRFSFGFM